MPLPLTDNTPIAPLFKSSEEENRILNYKDKTKDSLLKSPLGKAWSVVWYTTQIPLRVPLFIAARIAVLGARCFKITSLENRATIFSYHLLSPYLNTMFTHLTDSHGELICATLNIQKLNTLGLIGQTPTAYEEITNTHLKPFLRSDWKEMQYAHPNGACRGASQLYLALHMRLADKFEDPYALHYAITQEFSKGVPEIASYLHSLDKTESLLGYKEKKVKEFPLEKVKSSSEEFTEFLTQLSSGRYLIGLPALAGDGHAVCLCKEKDGSLFFFDIDRGTFAASPETLPSNFAHTLNMQYGRETKLSGSISFTKLEAASSGNEEP